VNSAYFVLVGRLVDANVDGPALQTLFSSKVGVALRQVTDGTSNTLAIVEAKREIPWTKPEDLPFDMSVPLTGLGSHHAAGSGHREHRADARHRQRNQIPQAERLRQPRLVRKKI